jgi:glycerol-3-phosphate dehydrogenase
MYYDAAVDDARLTLANARGAHESGAAVVPHAEVIGFVATAAGCAAPGCATASRARRWRCARRWCVNATGPWSDAVRRLADPGAKPRLRTTKGVHVMVPRERVGNRHAITFQSPVDGG